MTKKRARLEPGIRRTVPSNQYPKGGYQARLTFQGTEYERTFARLADARRWRNDKLTDLRRGDAHDERKGRTPFREVAERWLDRSADLKPNTRDGYNRILNRHVLPAFGKQAVGRIKRQDVQKFVNQLTAKPGTVRNVFRVLNPVLNLAVEEGLIPSNPCVGVRLPRVNQDDVEEMHFLSARQVTELADEVTQPYGLLVNFAAYTGLRAGELAALRVKHIDLLHGEVYARESVSDTNGHLHYGTPKTKASRRTVPLPGFLVEELNAYLEAHPRKADALLFSSPNGGPFRHKNFYRRHFKKAVVRLVDRAEWPQEMLSLRFHDLRHTYASLLIKNGEHPRMVMALLGHSSIAVTMDRYSHVFPEDKVNVAARLHDLRRDVPAPNVVTLG